MNTKIVQKIKKVPKSPGVYIYRNDKRKIIYVGKAIVLKNRISSYFQNMEHDPKTEELVKNIHDLEWIVVDSEFEALILEADLIKRYKPKYNIRFRDDKNYSYLKISSDNYPKISVVHQITDSNAKYIGPFTDTNALRSILKLARHIFPYCTCSLTNGQICLYYHLKLCPGHDEKYISKSDYAKNIKGLISLFSGKTKKIEEQIKKNMKSTSKNQQFEKAAEYRDKLRFIKKIQHTHLFSDRELSADAGLRELTNKVELPEIPKRIECFDISNVMGTAAVGSMVVFKNGIASPRDYRRFKIKTVNGPDDFASMAEVLSRRFTMSETKKSDDSFCQLPNLVILDGGKGQLSTVLNNVDIPKSVIVVALAKKREEIFSVVARRGATRQSVLSSRVESRDLKKEISPLIILGRNDKVEFQISNLPPGGEAMYLIQRIRDEAHRFAITYHRNIKSNEIYKSSLDSIIGVGPKTKKKLILNFGSVKKIKEASVEDLSKVISEKIAKKIKETL